VHARVVFALALGCHVGMGTAAASENPRRTDARAFPIDMHRFRVLDRDSGPVSYTGSPGPPWFFIRGVYKCLEPSPFAEWETGCARGVERIRFRGGSGSSVGAKECVLGTETRRQTS